MLRRPRFLVFFTLARCGFARLRKIDRRGNRFLVGADSTEDPSVMRMDAVSAILFGGIHSAVGSLQCINGVLIAQHLSHPKTGGNPERFAVVEELVILD